MKHKQKKVQSINARRYSDKDLFKQVTKLAKELGRTPSSVEFGHCSWTTSYTTIVKRFGSWGNFIELAKLKPNIRGLKKKYSKDELIQQVCVIASKLGRNPTAEEFGADPHTASVNTVANYFGSWNEFLEEASLIPTKRNYTEKDLIRQLQSQIEKLGRVPTLNEFNRNPETACTRTIRKYFGNWSNFLQKANLDPNITRRKYSKGILILQIKMLSEEIGHKPVAIEFSDNPKTASLSTVYSYFGTWNRALEEAGFSVRHRKAR